MNLSQSIFLLSDEAADFLRALYRKTKIADSVQLNFLAASLQIPANRASQTATQLHALGLVRYEPYGRIRLTPEGKTHAARIMQTAVQSGR